MNICLIQYTFYSIAAWYERYLESIFRIVLKIKFALYSVKKLILLEAVLNSEKKNSSQK